MDIGIIAAAIILLDRIKDDAEIHVREKVFSVAQHFVRIGTMFQ
jgi:hypothetical protein